MPKNRPVLLLSIVLIISLTACNLPVGQTTDVSEPTVTSTVQIPSPESPTPDLALTITAQALLLESPTPDLALTITAQVLALEATSPVATIQQTATPEFTQTPELTQTPSVTTVTVSQNTNCRKGPGIQYDENGALLIGQIAEVVGKNSASNYWIIKTPGNSSGTCWLWGQYATVSGDTSALAEATVPPTPIVLPPAAPSNLIEKHTCSSKSAAGIYQATGTLTWHDNSSNEDGFNIYWTLSADDSAATVVGTVGANSTSYAFSVPSFGAGTYLVEAFNTAGASKKVRIEIRCP